jgi:restriction system protein
MSIPTQFELTLPLLEMCKDGEVHTLSEANSYLAKHFNLNDDIIEDRLDSGEKKLSNYTRWAAWHLKKAALLESSGVGKFRITSEGLKTLKSKPKAIDNQFLQTIDRYRESSRIRKEYPQIDDEVVSKLTPEAIIEIAYRKHENALAEEIVDNILSCSFRFFENLVIDLLVRMGYGGSRQDAAYSLGQVGDEGVDGIIKEDELGLDSIYIQAKRWKDKTVGRPDIQTFVGSLDGKRAKKGIFITTSNFAQTAKDYVLTTEKRVALIDGNELARLMIKYGVGVSETGNFSVKRIDKDFFSE